MQLRFIVSWLWTAFCKRFKEEIILCYTVQEEDMKYFQVQCSHYLHSYGLHTVQEEEQNFRFIVYTVYMVVACIIMYCQRYQ